MKQRLQKILSGAGIASRRASEALIVEGRVHVDGVVVRELGVSADPETQEIRVDGARVRSGQKRHYLALNKPPGFITTRSDPGRRRTVMDLLPIRYKHLYPVGRLDMPSSGLLILTDDGAFAQRLMHPSYGVEKTYMITVMGHPTPPELNRATRGVTVDFERLSVDRVKLLDARVPKEGAKPRAKLRVSLRQGRNREIRRLFKALGHPVVALHREQIGQLSVKGLPSGAFRELTPAELVGLRRGPGAPAQRRTRVK